MTLLETTLRERVHAVLTDRIGIDGLQTTPSGYGFRLFSSQLLVLVHEHAPGKAFIRLQGLAGEQVPLSAQLFEHVAIHGGDWLYGHLNVVPTGPGVASVVLRHEFAGKYVTDDELEEAIRTFGGTLEQLDDQLTAQFGGHRAHEDE